MLFKDYHIWPMYTGLKTYTRRLWKRPHVKIGGTYDVTRKMYPKPEDVIGTIYVEDLYRQPLGMMTVVDAMCEGGYGHNQYYWLLDKINKKPVPRDTVVWVVKFRFSLSDCIDGNGGNIEKGEYHRKWIEHMKGIGMSDKEIQALDKCVEGDE